jgi:hypothetical protein
MILTSFIAQTAALTGDDPSSQLETLPSESINEAFLHLVGQIISQNNQTVNATLTKAWFFATPLSFAVIGPNTFLFKFPEKEHITRILNQVWNVNGCLIALQTWSPTATLGELSLNTVPLWIQVHGLPLHNMSLKNSIAIGKGLGNLVKIDNANGVDSTFRSFLRLLVEIDVSKPLNSGFLFTKMDNSTTWISLKYERLDVYCTDCGLIGHKQNSCLAPQANKIPIRYKISLKVNIFSNLNSSPLSLFIMKIYPPPHLLPESPPFSHAWQAPPHPPRHPMQTNSFHSATLTCP